MPEETLLFCLPHAGGSAGFYLPLAEHLPRWLRLVPVELPGRGRRSIEPPCGDFEQLAEDVAARIRGGLERSGQPRYAVFGHSLGAILAFYEARKLERIPRSMFFFPRRRYFIPVDGTRRRRVAVTICRAKNFWSCCAKWAVSRMR